MIKRFMVFGALIIAAVPALSQPVVVCESDGSYRQCEISGPGRVILSRQISDAACVEGRSWGVRDGKVWVDQGCRAEFALTERGFTRQSVQLAPNIVVCESDGKRARCAVDTRGGVSLSRQISKSACIEGSTWGYTTSGIWVDSGCRAEFLVGSARRSDPVRRIERRGINDLYLTCESDGKRRICGVDTRQGVRMVRKISDSSCDFGRDWGYDPNGIWVTNGCRAEFAVTYDVVGARVDPATYTRLVCESANDSRRDCRVDTGFGVQLTRQISDSECEFGRTWGYDRNGVWVTNGCRAEFTILNSRGSTGMISSLPASTVLCESPNNGRKHCPAETQYGVALSRRISSSSCDFRRDWGFDQDGIWVNNGCRAEFILDNDR